MPNKDTIAAIATALSSAGVGIIRISGPQSYAIAEAISQTKVTPRYAHYLNFYDENNEVLDKGILLYFKQPFSFTGEEVVELHGHGGLVVLHLLLNRVLSLGARQANPGEFSERAFLNGKLDLLQAEATADLINASSEQAARSAMRSLAGEFSHKINTLLEGLTTLRVYVEAALDFSDEDIDFLATGKISAKLESLLKSLSKILKSSQQGILLQEGLTIAILGDPNAGKSSLLNALSGQESAIVTDVPGTTRDLVREHIHIEGMPLHIIDTAGIRDHADIVEQEGIKRALQTAEKADHILLVIAANDAPQKTIDTYWQRFSLYQKKITVIINKIDLAKPELKSNYFYLSAKKQQGIEQLKKHLHMLGGYQQAAEGVFSARRRHLDALYEAKISIKQALSHISMHELLAEDLRLAQQSLSKITGDFSSDDLLGAIFSEFCVGK